MTELMNLLAERLGEYDKFEKSASEALIVGDKVAYQWRQQIAAGDTPWLPQSILEAL